VLQRRMTRILLLVTMLLAACTIGENPDPGPGSGSDGSGSDMPPKPSDVTITVHDGDAPTAGAIVVFQNAEGGVIADTTTDASGAATAKVAIGFVSVVVPSTTGPAAYYTYAGVKGGDKLELVRPALPGAPRNVTVHVPIGSGGSI